MREIRVELDKKAPDRSYPIFIERGLLDKVGGRMRRLGLKGVCALVTNPAVGALYSERVLNSLRKAGFSPIVVTVPDGEKYKTLKEVSRIYDRLLEEKLERDSSIIALGGGVTGDMAGFAAATFLRGVPYIQIPTTLLAQVDSSVGGKTGVNHPLGKNLIGAFYQPKAVFIDPDVLKTLERREKNAGLGEVVKYGIIRDKKFFSHLEDKREKLLNQIAGPEILEKKKGDEIIRAIERSCEIKAEIVSRDEKERGLRSILNFGHTFGHAVEALTNYTGFKHGEAVSIGMVMAAGLSFKLGMAREGVVKRIENLLSALGLPTRAPLLKPSDFIETMRLDKKVKAGRVRFVLIKDIGSAVLEEVSEEKLRDFLRGKAGANCLRPDSP